MYLLVYLRFRDAFVKILKEQPSEADIPFVSASVQYPTAAQSFLFFLSQASIPLTRCPCSTLMAGSLPKAPEQGFRGFGGQGILGVLGT